MAIKITGDNLQYDDTAIASLSSTALTLASGKGLIAQNITASAGLKVSGSSEFNDEVVIHGSLTVLGAQTLGDVDADSLSVTGHATFNGELTASMGMSVPDDKKLYFGTGYDASIEYDEDGTDELRFAGAAVTFEQAVTFDGAVTLGDATSDDVVITGRLAADVDPKADNTYALGASSLRYSEAHINALHADSLGQALDANDQAITNVNVDSGAIDGTVIGANSAAAGTFAALVATSATVNGNSVLSGTLNATSAVTLGSTLEVEGTSHLNGAVTADGAVDIAGDLTAATITCTGFAVDADGDTALKSLAVDNSSTIGCDADTDMMTLANQSLALANDVDFNVAKAGGFQYAGTAVTATATELNYNDITTLGTAQRSKVVTADASDKITLGAFEIEGSNFDINGGAIDGTAIGAASPAAANVTSLTASSLAVMDGMTYGFGFDPAGAGGDGLMQIGANTKSITSSVYATWRPGEDGAFDLGASGAEWKDLYLDGVAYIDDLRADALGAALNCASQAMTNINVDSGAIDGTTIGANSAAAGTFTAIVGTSAVVSGTLNATGVTTLGNNLEVEGTSHLNGNVTIDNDLAVGSYGLTSAGAATIASMAGNWTNASRTVADMGTVTTMDLNGGSIDGTVIGANSAAAGTFAAIVGTSLNVSDGNITNVGSIACDSVTSDAATGLSLDGSSVTTSGGFAVAMPDNLAVAFQVMQGANSYMKFVTTDGSEAITVHEDLTLDNDKDAKARSFITYSDATLKQDIKPLDGALDKVMSMRGVSYEFKGQASVDGSSHREVGFLAQEMKQSVPEVVYGNGDGNLGIDYAKLTSVLVEAVKSQQEQIEELRAALLKK